MGVPYAEEILDNLLKPKNEQLELYQRNIAVKIICLLLNIRRILADKDGTSQTTVDTQEFLGRELSQILGTHLGPFSFSLALHHRPRSFSLESQPNSMSPPPIFILSVNTGRDICLGTIPVT